MNLCKELDLSLDKEWESLGENARYEKSFENERVFEFLVGLNRNLDDVRGRILSRRPLPTTREVFAEVRREENRRKIMMKIDKDENAMESVMLSRRNGPRLKRNGKLSNGLTAVNGPNGSHLFIKGGCIDKSYNGPSESIRHGINGSLSIVTKK